MYKKSILAVVVSALVVVGCSQKTEVTEKTSTLAPTNAPYTDPLPVDDTASSPVDTNSFTYTNADEIVNLATQAVKAGNGVLKVNITMPEGYKFNNTAAFRASFNSNHTSVTLPETWAKYEQVMPTMPLEIPVKLSDGVALITGDLMIYWCEAINETLCFVDHRVLSIPVSVSAEAATNEIEAALELIPPVS